MDSSKQKERKKIDGEERESVCVSDACMHVLMYVEIKVGWELN